MLRSRYNGIEGNCKSKYFLMIVHSDGHLKELCIKASSRNTTFILTGDIQSGLPPFKPPPFSYSFVSTNIQRSMLAKKNVNVKAGLFFHRFLLNSSKIKLKIFSKLKDFFPKLRNPGIFSDLGKHIF